MRASRTEPVTRSVVDGTEPLSTGCYNYSKEKDYEFQVSRHINEVHDAYRQ